MIFFRNEESSLQLLFKSGLCCVFPTWASLWTLTGSWADLKADWGQLYNIGDYEGSATQLFCKPGLCCIFLPWTSLLGRIASWADLMADCIMCVLFGDAISETQLFHGQSSEDLKSPFLCGSTLNNYPFSDHVPENLSFLLLTTVTSPIDSLSN